MLAIASYLSILLGVGTLAWGYAAYPPLARWILFLGALWLFAHANRQWWASSLALPLTILTAAIGLWYGTGSAPHWIFASGIFSLLAWDLADFSRRIEFENKTEELRKTIRQRLARLTLLALLGLLPASLIALLRSQFTAPWIFLLGFIVLLGTIQLPGWIQTR